MCFPLCLAQLLPSRVVWDRISSSTVSHSPFISLQCNICSHEYIRTPLAKVTGDAHAVHCSGQVSVPTFLETAAALTHLVTLSSLTHFLHGASSFCFYLTDHSFTVFYADFSFHSWSLNVGELQVSSLGLFSSIFMFTLLLLSSKHIT